MNADAHFRILVEIEDNGELPFQDLKSIRGEKGIIFDTNREPNHPTI